MFKNFTRKGLSEHVTIITMLSISLALLAPISRFVFLKINEYEMIEEVKGDILEDELTTKGLNYHLKDYNKLLFTGDDIRVHQEKVGVKIISCYKEDSTPIDCFDESELINDGYHPKHLFNKIGFESEWIKNPVTNKQSLRISYPNLEDTEFVSDILWEPNIKDCSDFNVNNEFLEYDFYYTYKDSCNSEVDKILLDESVYTDHYQPWPYNQPGSMEIINNITDLNTYYDSTTQEYVLPGESTYLFNKDPFRNITERQTIILTGESVILGGNANISWVNIQLDENQIVIDGLSFTDSAINLSDNKNITINNIWLNDNTSLTLWDSQHVLLRNVEKEGWQIDTEHALYITEK